MIEIKEICLSRRGNGEKYMRKLYDDCHNYIRDLTAFGWQLAQDTTE